MTKSELKTGMRVEMRNGKIYLVLKDCETKNHDYQNIFFASEYGFMPGSDYTEDLKIKDDNELYDIVKIYTCPNGFVGGDVLRLSERSLIWERDPIFTYQVDITVTQTETIKAKSMEEAKAIAKQIYEDGEIIYTAEDCIEIEVYKRS